MKTCADCHDPKLLSEFYKRSDKKGYRPNCKACFKKKERLRNNSDKEKARLAVIKDKEAMERDPHGFLAEAVIYRAVLDKDDGFFETWWYEMLRDTANIEERNVLRCRKHILEEQDA